MTLALLVLLPILFLVISLVQRKSIKQFSTFALDRNAFGPLPIYCSILASGVGAGVMMGNAEKAYQMEWAYPLGCLGFSLQLVLTAWLAPRIHQWRGCLSTGEILGKAYGGQDVRFISGALWLIFCMGIITAQIVAMQRVVSMIIPQWQAPVTMALMTSVILYSCLGGIRSVVTTDVFQALILISALVAITAWGVNHLGGIEYILQPVMSEDQNFSTAFSLPKLAIIFIGFLLGDALIPVSIQRVTMARTARQASLAMMITAIMVFFVTLLCAVLGLIAYQLDATQANDQTLTILLNAMPSGFRLALVTALMAAIMSSCDSYLNTAAVAFTHDLLPSIARPLSDSWQLLYGRIATLVIGAGAMLLSYGVDDILDILLSTFEAWGPTLLPPLFVALFYPKLPKRCFYLPALTGLATLFLWKGFCPDQWIDSSALIAGMAGNSLCMMVVFRSGHLK